MIIDESTTSDERSPLKGPNSSLPSGGTALSSRPPPPPYTPAHPHSIPHLPPPPHAVIRERTVERFLKAFTIALLVIFLWGALFDSMTVLVAPGRRFPLKDVFAVDHYVRLWYYRQAAAALPPSPPSSLSPLSLPNTLTHAQSATTTMIASRVLPLEYPPLGR